MEKIPTYTNCPNVSVIMPCYNHSKYIRKSIDGVLRQSYADIELIVVDDDSKDESVDIVETYKKEDNRIKTVYHDGNMGVSKSRNDAISISRGKYIAFCDADDIWEKDKLEIQCKCLEDNPEFDVVFSDSIVINEDGISIGKKFSDTHRYDYRKDVFIQLCLTNFINTQTVVLRRSCLDGNIMFNEGMKYLEDWLYWIELAREHKFMYIDIPLAKYRIHSGSTRHDKKNYYACRIIVYKMLLDRYHKIPRDIQSRLHYLIGVNYLELENKKLAREHFYKSIKEYPLNIKSIYRAISV